MILQEINRDNFQKEYGILCHRIYPTDRPNTPFGSSWCIVEVGRSTDPHDHEVSESFFILEGEGVMSIDETTFSVRKGSVLYIPSLATHTLTNTSPSQDLVFLSVWWDEKTEPLS